MTPDTFDDVHVDGTRIAANEDYLKSVLDEWNSETRPLEVQTKVLDYKADACMFGHVIRRKPPNSDSDSDNDSDAKVIEAKSLPGILLFHSEAGPKDISLFHKADLLCQQFDCVVVICDILSDAYGWAWGPQSSLIHGPESSEIYQEIHRNLMADDASVLRQRASAPAQALIDQLPEVDPHRMAAMGWCLGGQSILELGRVQSTNYTIQAMATFDGGFSRETPPAIKETDEEAGDTTASAGGKVLICNDREDPCVSAEDLKSTKAFLESNGWNVQVQQCKEGGKDEVSNSKQDSNESPDFGYNQDAAKKSWDAALALLKNSLYL